MGHLYEILKSTDILYLEERERYLKGSKTAWDNTEIKWGSRGIKWERLISLLGGLSFPFILPARLSCRVSDPDPVESPPSGQNNSAKNTAKSHTFFTPVV